MHPPTSHRPRTILWSAGLGTNHPGDKGVHVIKHGVAIRVPGGKGYPTRTPKDISRALKAAASDLEYDTKRGIPIDRIDSHSLRAGGANSLSLAGFSEHEIQIMGRWRSATFKEYISDQLSSFTDGMAKAMSKTFQFVNIAAGTLTDVTASLVPAAA